jgi:hypothetical protein
MTIQLDLNTIGSICSILSFFIALFVATKVYQISNISKTTNKLGKGSKVGQDFSGRDKISK